MTTRRSPRAPFALLAALACAGCTARVNSVQLSLATSRGPTPLLCRTGTSRFGPPHMMMMPPPDAGTYLLDRARATGSVRVVLDYGTIGGGVPAGCMTSQILDHCAAHCCATVVPARVCLEVPLPEGTADASAPVLADAILQALRGRVATQAAPDGYVIVRVVATTETCDAVAASGGVLPRFDTTQLIGCAYSCPVVLASVQGTLALGLSSFSDLCENDVDACAHLFEDITTGGCAAGSDP